MVWPFKVLNIAEFAYLFNYSAPRLQGMYVCYDEERKGGKERWITKASYLFALFFPFFFFLYCNFFSFFLSSRPNQFVMNLHGIREERLPAEKWRNRRPIRGKEVCPGNTRMRKHPIFEPAFSAIKDTRPPHIHTDSGMCLLVGCFMCWNLGNQIPHSSHGFLHFIM